MPELENRDHAGDATRVPEPTAPARRLTDRQRVATGVGVAAGAATVVASLVAVLSFLGMSPIGHNPSVAATPSASQGLAALTPAEMARAVVLVRMISADGLVGTGSGTIIDPSGLILTNAHVATPSDVTLTSLEVALTMAADAPAVAAYRAEVVASDGVLDLAIIRIVEKLDGTPVGDTFPYVPIGDSQALQIGDDLQILGYPGLGGDTITFTSGQVSGFTGDAVLGFRAWIKTDATVAAGNSGGLAANTAGQIIGVPTRAGTTSEVVDCRPIQDTNRDGKIDNADACVSVGGFINGLRPVAFAAAMIDAALHGVAYTPMGGLEQPSGSGNPTPIDTSNVSLTAMTFTTDLTSDDKPVDDVEWVATGAHQICAVWDYEGMQAGMSWEAVWSVNGDLVENFSFLDQTWGLGASGSYWVCATNDQGLRDGVYDLAVNVEGAFKAGGFVAIGDEFKPVTLTVENQGTLTVCYLFASPTLSGTWGHDRLGADQTLAPGESATLLIPAGRYDILGRDCDQKDLFTKTDVEVLQDTTVPFS